MPVRPAALAAVLLSLALAACGSSSDERNAAPAPPTTPTPSSSASASPSPSTNALVEVTPSPTAVPPGPAASSPPASPPPVDASRPPVETAPALGQPVCKAADLTLDDADAVITAESVQELFVVRTTGPDCQLQGYPEVVLRGEGGGPMTVTYTRGGNGLPTDQPGVVTLSRSTSLSFRVATPRTGGCTSASSVSARLPGTDGDLMTTTSLSVCQSQAGVSPVGRILAES